MYRQFICIAKVRHIITILLVCVTATQISAQGYYWQSMGKEKKIKNLTIDGAFGLRMYFGDIQSKGAIFNKPKIAYGLGARYQMHPRFGINLQLEGRGYSGKAVHGGQADAIDEMTGKLWGGHLMFEFSWLRWEDFTKKQFTDRDPVTKINMYVGAGFGGSMFNSSYTSRTYTKTTAVDSLGNKINIFIPVDNSGSAGGFGIYVPASFGVRLRYKPNICFGIELQRQFYITKNVDAYPSKKFDGMGSLMLRVGYTFGQTKRKGETKKITKKGKFK